MKATTIPLMLSAVALAAMAAALPVTVKRDAPLVNIPIHVEAEVNASHAADHWNWDQGTIDHTYAPEATGNIVTNAKRSAP
ncbi:hypothetical protein KI688_002275 [Linnemannia hyalina]|uniref:Uncharacterized protein n=1 Tax=Linnemannia hyalina TaxID=64524 RepID=A0A9P8BS73_9FUNG|nr:hypothetical protein KI688_002275 [Linnemannia hyalina]